jgi:hypothetical protein
MALKRLCTVPTFVAVGPHFREKIMACSFHHCALLG